MTSPECFNLFPTFRFFGYDPACKRNFLQHSGRVAFSGSTLCFRTSYRMQSAMYLLRYRLCLWRRLGLFHRRNRYEGKKLFVSAGRNNRRRTTSSRWNLRTHLPADCLRSRNDDRDQREPRYFAASSRMLQNSGHKMPFQRHVFQKSHGKSLPTDR